MCTSNSWASTEAIQGVTVTSEIVVMDIMQLRALFLVAVLVMTTFILLAGLMFFNHETSKYYLGHILMQHKKTNTSVTKLNGLL